MYRLLKQIADYLKEIAEAISNNENSIRDTDTSSEMTPGGEPGQNLLN